MQGRPQLLHASSFFLQLQRWKRKTWANKAALAQMVKMWLNAVIPVPMTMRPCRGGEASYHSAIMIKMWPGCCMLIKRLPLFSYVSLYEIIEDFWGCCHSLHLANLCFWVDFKEVLRPLFQQRLISCLFSKAASETLYGAIAGCYCCPVALTVFCSLSRPPQNLRSWDNCKSEVR